MRDESPVPEPLVLPQAELRVPGSPSASDDRKPSHRRNAYSANDLEHRSQKTATRAVWEPSRKRTTPLELDFEWRSSPRRDQVEAPPVRPPMTVETPTTFRA